MGLSEDLREEYELACGWRDRWRALCLDWMQWWGCGQGNPDDLIGRILDALRAETGLPPLPQDREALPAQVAQAVLDAPAPSIAKMPCPREIDSKLYGTPRPPGTVLGTALDERQP